MRYSVGVKSRTAVLVVISRFSNRSEFWARFFMLSGFYTRDLRETRVYGPDQLGFVRDGRIYGRNRAVFRVIVLNASPMERRPWSIAR